MILAYDYIGQALAAMDREWWRLWAADKTYCLDCTPEPWPAIVEFA